jgi:hypothetical protein
MEKPKRPTEPNIKDWTKYPDKGKSMRDMTHEEVENIPYIRDCKKYQKDLAQYLIDIEIYTQLKYIRIIQNAKEKKILEKFKITKIK